MMKKPQSGSEPSPTATFTFTVPEAFAVKMMKYIDENGYADMGDFIRELLRTRLNKEEDSE